MPRVRPPKAGLCRSETDRKAAAPPPSLLEAKGSHTREVTCGLAFRCSRSSGLTVTLSETPAFGWRVQRPNSTRQPSLRSDDWVATIWIVRVRPGDQSLDYISVDAGRRPRPFRLHVSVSAGRLLYATAEISIRVVDGESVAVMGGSSSPWGRLLELRDRASSHHRVDIPDSGACTERSVVDIEGLFCGPGLLSAVQATA